MDSVGTTRTILLVLGLAACLMIDPGQARPPMKKKTQHPEQPEVISSVNQNGTEDWDLGIEYQRYLQEVVQVLESDPEFRKKLEDADVDKIRDGSIAEELDFVHHGVRSRLDDIKRQELERLRHLAMRDFEMNQGIDRKHMKIPSYLEIQSPTFEKDDLKKLIQATTKDLEEADQKRREEFKHYEMEKKFRQDERLNHIDDKDKRKEEEDRMKEMEKKHKDHAKPHHPMTKEQLEEVWEETDHMRPDEFDPKTFFAMHDLNGDQVWDEDEVRMLFQKELDKVYDPNAPEDDKKEREEEMERMREHVFKESDINKDRLISYDEFLAETKREEYNKDPGWDTLDEEDPFTDEEFRAYEMQRQREIADMINRGIQPPGYPYYGDIPPGAVPYQHPQAQPQLGIPGQPAYKPEYDSQVRPGQHPQQGQFQQHPQQGQIPQHPQQGQFQQAPQQGQFQQQPPQQGQFQQPPQRQHGVQGVPVQSGHHQPPPPPPPQHGQPQFGGQPQGQFAGQGQQHPQQMGGGQAAQPQQFQGQGHPAQPQQFAAQPAQGGNMPPPPPGQPHHQQPVGNGPPPPVQVNPRGEGGNPPPPVPQHQQPGGVRVQGNP